MRHKAHIWDLKVADIEVGGDVHRIILGGVKSQPDTSALEFRRKLSVEYHALSQLMISYPYGNEDMCADFIFKSAHANAAFGYVIMESMGYPYYSGSNTIATVAALLEYEIIPLTEGESEIKLEAPGGIVSAKYTIRDGDIISVTVDGGAAYVIFDHACLDVPGVGPVEYALVWSGAYFIMVEAQSLGIPLTKEGIPAMKAIGYALTDAISRDFTHHHEQFGLIESPRFVYFLGDFEKMGEKRYRGRGATFGYPNTVYYCPTGTGTSARMALLHSRAEMEPDATFDSISPMGNQFVGQAIGKTAVGSYDALATNIMGRPFVLATTQMHIDFDNPLMAQYKSLREIAEQPAES